MNRDEYRAYLQSAAWVRRRQAALDAFGHRCGVCYSNGRLSVHHRTYERCGHEDISDLIPLCEECHELFHGRGTIDSKYGLPVWLVEAIRCISEQLKNRWGIRIAVNWSTGNPVPYLDSFDREEQIG